MEKNNKTIYLINLMIEMLPNYEQSGIYRVQSFHMGKLCEFSTFITLIDSAISFDNTFGPRRDKTCLRGFRQRDIQTSLLSYRDLLEY